MTLGERIQTILKQRNIKQIDFAKSLGISANYVNLIVNDRKNCVSDTLAMLIEETYGYSSKWVLEGTGEMTISSDLTASKMQLLRKIQKMSENEVKATLAFVATLESVSAQFLES
ncbi:MAG: helix-turn-helix domain-containing protein [Defluviitaleaceae bacterium]|nr:helix-turn-helix domain-containing protein [Defluviitaleaceae bacterium]